MNRFVFIVVCSCIALLSCKNDKKAINQTKVFFKKEGVLTIFKSDSTTISLDIEIADNEYETQTGMMYRSGMKDSQGMLFVFDDERPRSFYMKNTRIPLDIIYISEDKKIVSFQKNAKPFDETSLPSNAPAKYVLEVNAGLSDLWSIDIGNAIEYSEL
ncbi:DUF192 domain-containing protein [Aestuariivivens sediminicola]|uniref:DUF192 domain-containing protein n=1 Tax=Aestuariivivens sediminicola TaxID=2913560 RepID=UPI001F5ACB8E|nr:DUF192 domain-containing protein [Aestuariivivens sediminicola]